MAAYGECLFILKLRLIFQVTEKSSYFPLVDFKVSTFVLFLSFTAIAYANLC